MFTSTRPSSFCIQAGFRKILMQGRHQVRSDQASGPRWDAAGNIRFIFGYEATDGLKDRADELPAEAIQPSETAAKVSVDRKPIRVKNPSVSNRRLSESEATRTFA